MQARQKKSIIVTDKTSQDKTKKWFEFRLSADCDIQVAGFE